MTLRRLNIEIQGYPESYAAEPIDMVGSEVGPLYSPPPPPPPQASLPIMQSRDDDGTTTTNVARPPLDNATHVNLGSGGEQQEQNHHQGDSKNYENGPLPPSPTNENNKRIKTSPAL
jgi:hypothetical protein